MALKYTNLRDFGLAFFDEKKDTSGAANPIRIREAAKTTRRDVEAIKRGKSKLLNICSITGIVGIYGENISAAEVKISKDGGFDRHRILVHDSVNQGMRHKGRTILSVIREGWQARIGISRIGKVEKPFVRIYRAL